jgi:DNA-binding XRE family transcriptional regulator
MKLTQSQLAQRLGLTSTSVARMERGEQKIMPVTALAVKYLQVMESKTRGKKTSKVLEAIFQRGSVWWIAFYHRGHEIRQSSHRESETQARKLLKKRLGEVTGGRFVAD